MSAPANPYVGPRAFQDGEDLHGRIGERRDLLDQLIAERIVLLYSPSGAGKTSLLQAAITPDLADEEFRVLPIVRVSTPPPPGSTVNRYLYSLLHALDPELPENFREAARQPDLPLADILGALANENTLRTVIIFDQFEEMFTIDALDSREREEFFRQVGLALRNPNLWAIFAMREDYIANLDPYANLIPTRLVNRFRLDLLTAAAALDAIRRPAEKRGVSFEPEAAQQLVDNLRRTSGADGTPERLGAYVEPVHLQIVCLQLWERLRPEWDEGRTLTVDAGDVSTSQDVDEALGDYYDGQLAKIVEDEADPEQRLLRERRIREWFDNRLITPQNIRAQVLQGSDDATELGDETIRRLINAYLVRTEDRRSATWYELAHDRLVAPVRARNEAWFRSHFSRFKAQADLWNRRDRDPDLLFTGQLLDDAENWAERHPGRLGAKEEAFLAACRDARRVRKAEKRNKLLVQLGLLGSLAGLFVAVGLWREAEGAKHDAVEAKVKGDRATTAYVKLHGSIKGLQEQAVKAEGRLNDARLASSRDKLRFQAEAIARRAELNRKLAAEREKLRQLDARFRSESGKADAEREKIYADMRSLKEEYVQQDELIGDQINELEDKERAAQAQLEANLLKLNRVREYLASLDLPRDQWDQINSIVGEGVKTLTPTQQAAQSRLTEAAGTSGLASLIRPNSGALKLWKNGTVLRVRFMDGPRPLQDKVLRYAQGWSAHANIRFARSDDPHSEVRVSFKGDGAWSYVGTDALAIPASQPTVTLGWLDNPTASETGIRQTTLHEFGHVLGLIHEQQNPNADIPWNRKVVYQFFKELGVAEGMVDANVLTKPRLPSYRPFDPHSVMIFGNYPASLFTRPFEMSQGSGLSESDKKFIGQLYPR